MPAIRLVIADVDGTLLTREKLLTARALSSARALKTAGVTLAVTSARPPRGLAMLVAPLAIEVPMAAFNGGTYVRPDLSPIETLTVAPATVASAIDILEKHALDVWVYRDADWLVRHVDAPHVSHEQHTVRFSPTVVSGFDGFLDRVVKIVGVSDDPSAVSRCLADLHWQLPGAISAARSQPYYLDVTHPNANKGRVVEWISRFLNVPLEHVAAIGDMPNDVPMLRMAGLGIAMGHSDDDVKRSARVVTASSEEEGFARAMEQCVLERS
jgi:Cof subfamily protein (haloacid dehalogenase superfamily)